VAVQADGAPHEPSRSKAADDSTQNRESLLVGIIAEGNPNANPTNRLLRELQLVAQKASERHPARHRVQFIIYVPSALVKPGFEGVRLGSYTRAQNQQNVLIAVPQRLETGLKEFLAGALDEGWQLAQEGLKKKHVSGESIAHIAHAASEVLKELRHGQSSIGN
jgi:hypothetical protein